MCREDNGEDSEEDKKELEAEALLVRLLLNGDAGVGVRRELAGLDGRARNDALQPGVAIVLVVELHLLALDLLTRRSVEVATALGSTAAADQSALLAGTGQKVGDGAAGTGLDEHHPADSRAHFTREQAEDRVGSTSVEGVRRRDGVAATAVLVRVDVGVAASGRWRWQLRRLGIDRR